MVRTKSSKQPATADFVRRKQKVGKRKNFTTGHTVTTFRSQRITVPAQLSKADPQAATLRGQTAADLLAKSRHFSPAQRRQCLLGLREFVRSHPSPSLACSVLRNVARLVIDEDASVRNAIVPLVRDLLSRHEFHSACAPFLPQFIQLCIAALTHPTIPIRIDAVAVIDAVTDVLPTGIPVADHVPLLNALVAVLGERVNTNVLNGNRKRASPVLRCIRNLLASLHGQRPTQDAPAPCDPIALAVLHNGSLDDDVFPSCAAQEPVAVRPSCGSLADVLVECCIECSGVDLGEALHCLTLLPNIDDASSLRRHVLPRFPVRGHLQSDLHLALLVATYDDPDKVVAFLVDTVTRSCPDNPDTLLAVMEKLPPPSFSVVRDALSRAACSSRLLSPIRLHALSVLRHDPQFSAQLGDCFLAHCQASSPSNARLLVDHLPSGCVPAILNAIDQVPGELHDSVVALVARVRHVDDDLLRCVARCLPGCQARCLLLESVVSRADLPVESVLSLLLTAARVAGDRDAELLHVVRNCIGRVWAPDVGAAMIEAARRRIEAGDPVAPMLHVVVACLERAAAAPGDVRWLADAVWRQWDASTERAVVVDVLRCSRQVSLDLVQERLPTKVTESVVSLFAERDLLSHWRGLPRDTLVGFLGRAQRDASPPGLLQALQCEMSIILHASG
ncbi:Pre-rRNA-processing protein Ipi1 N-terminal domain-containing protein [Plasmodiophora brassicae]|uniref:Pre-rRNA-processing protein Ipi1 N-terminal domain-containing protein n=1 Tax=Plasmodiophora brassicae TaxID=37360 RepID=A0A0G4IT57_PLABS|nr:hypothetical protein PBRA_006647 [Plasmodiophora brassicae]SPQ95837.1 unnamed protein product [Plasmodiophora brassicae]